MEHSEELEPRRLTPTMSSRKLLALDFIKRYFIQWGRSPTLGELAAELDVSRKRAHDLVHQLAEEQMIEHESGRTRGIRLVDRNEELSEADVLLQLQAMGWTIGRGTRIILPPDHAVGAITQGLTEKELPELAELDHIPGVGDLARPTRTNQAGRSGVGINGEEGEAGHSPGAAAAARRTARGSSGRLGPTAP